MNSWWPSSGRLILSTTRSLIVTNRNLLDHWLFKSAIYSLVLSQCWWRCSCVSTFSLQQPTKLQLKTWTRKVNLSAALTTSVKSSICNRSLVQISGFGPSQFSLAAESLRVMAFTGQLLLNKMINLTILPTVQIIKAQLRIFRVLLVIKIREGHKIRVYRQQDSSNNTCLHKIHSRPVNF